MMLRLRFGIRSCTSLLVGLFAIAPSNAQDMPAPRFIVQAADGPLAATQLAGLGKNWTLELAEPQRVLGVMEWIGVRQAGRARPPMPTAHFVMLGSGDRLPINPNEPVALIDGRIVFAPAPPVQPRDGKKLSIFAPHVALIFREVPQGVDDVEVFIADLVRGSRETDVVYLRNGDRIEGTVTFLGGTDGCEVSADGKKVLAPWQQLAGIAFATSGLARPKPKMTHGLAVLEGGARVHCASLVFDSGPRRWLGRTTTGLDLSITEAGLVALDLLRGRAVYLSDLPHAKYEHTPYLGLKWPIGLDASVDGRPLRVGADCYDKGVGLHGRCRLTYRLDGRFDWFEAVVGLDPSMGAKGRVVISVIVDGKELALGDGKIRTADDAPLAVQLDVRGARELTLAVDLGEFGDVQARVTWGGARLIKNES